MDKQDNSNHKSFGITFIAGGLAGTAAAVATCPLDVVQTRLQSSVITLPTARSVRSVSMPAVPSVGSNVGTVMAINARPFGLQVISYMRHIINTEGYSALYKGLTPNLVGILPGRAIYFSFYSKAKDHLMGTNLTNRTWIVYTLSALFASWSTSTITNPIWFLKTRLQLDLTESGKRKKIAHVIKDVFKNEGIRGFYRGLSASYVGASETIMYFVLYEKMKEYLTLRHADKTLGAFDYMVGASAAKTLATLVCYPHEVARTRLRQESLKKNSKKLYAGFFQTLQKVWIEEGMNGIYGGLGAHLMKQVPNTAIMFLSYECIVNYMKSE